MKHSTLSLLVLSVALPSTLFSAPIADAEAPLNALFTQTTAQDELGRILITLIDRRSKSKLISFYSVDSHRLEGWEEWSAGGALVERASFTSKGMVREQFLPKRRTFMREIEDGVRRSTIFDYSSGERTSTQEELPVEFSKHEAQACTIWSQLPHGSVSGVIALGPPLLRAESETDGRTPLSTHVAAEANCQTRYPGGTNAMASDLSSALRTLTQCLGNSPSRARRMDLARLLAVMQSGHRKVGEGLIRGLTLKCPNPGEPRYVSTSGKVNLMGGDVAYAEGCESSSYPAIALNPSSMQRKSPNERQSLLVHEMMHLLGYSHSETFDVPYLVEYACFGVTSPLVSTAAKAFTEKKAKEVLHQDPQPAPNSDAYLSAIGPMLSANLNSDVAAATIARQCRTRSDAVACISSQATYAALANSGSVPNVVVQSLLHAGANGNQPNPAVAPYSTLTASTSDALPQSGPGRELLNAYASAYHCRIRGDNACFGRAWDVIIANRASGCAALSTLQKLGLSNFTRATSFETTVQNTPLAAVAPKTGWFAGCP